MTAKTIILASRRSRISAYRYKGRYGITVEEVATAAGVGAFNIGAEIANDKINAQRVAAGKKALGPFLNLKSGIRYLQTGVGLVVAMGRFGAGQKAIGKTMFLASLPQTMAALVEDVMTIMGKTPPITAGVRISSVPAQQRIVAVAPQMAQTYFPPSVGGGGGSLSQEIALAGGYGK